NPTQRTARRILPRMRRSPRSRRARASCGTRSVLAKASPALLVLQRILDAEPAAPAVAEQMHAAEAERLTHRLDLLDIAADGPQRLVLRLVGVAGAELVVGDHAIAGLDQRQQRVAQVGAGDARPAVQQEQDLVALPVAVRDDLVAADPDLARVGLALLRHAPLPLATPRRPFHLTQRRPTIPILAGRWRSPGAPGRSLPVANVPKVRKVMS